LEGFLITGLLVPLVSFTLSVLGEEGAAAGFAAGFFSSEAEASAATAVSPLAHFLIASIHFFRSSEVGAANFRFWSFFFLSPERWIQNFFFLSSALPSSTFIPSKGIDLALSPPAFLEYSNSFSLHLKEKYRS